MHDRAQLGRHPRRDLVQRKHVARADRENEIAERVVQLGGVAEGTVRMAAKRTSLSEYPTNTADGRSHVEALSSVMAAFGKSVRRARIVSEPLSDYQRWSYSIAHPMVAAGEDIRWVPRRLVSGVRLAWTKSMWEESMSPSRACTQLHSSSIMSGG